MKTLVAYFSVTGSTKRVAQRLSRAADADEFEIIPAQPYSTEDLNWTNRTARAALEMHDDAVRPEFVGELADAGSYERIFVGFPVWMFVEPRIIDSFLEAYGFSGAQVIPFSTSSGSGIGGAPERMQKIVPHAQVLPGRVFPVMVSEAELKMWVASLQA